MTNQIESSALAVGVDLGKTGCRAVAAGREMVAGPGSPGLAEPGGARAAAAAVGAVLDRLLVALDHHSRAPLSVCVGAAGAEAAPAATAQLAELLGAATPGARIAVTSDAVTAHAGALAGEPGTVLAVGTGSVALGLDAAGRATRTDGWGPWLGDDGSGAWIGREALRAVLRARERRGAETALTAAATARFGDLPDLPATLAASGEQARTTAAFVPEVLACAAAGDEVAGEVLRRAVTCWVELALPAVRGTGTGELVLTGGLAQAPALVDAFGDALAARAGDSEVVLRAAVGGSHDGALLLAARRDLPHEPAVLRQPPLGPAPTVVQADRTDQAHQVDALATEQVRPDLADLDAREPSEVVRLLLDAEATVPAALAAARTALVAAVELATEALTGGGRIVYVGAGTPGRLAALDAAECPPTFGIDPATVVALCAGGEAAAREAVEGAEDDAAAGADDVAGLDVGPRDLVVGITASGRTPYVLAALAEAARRGARTVAVVNNPGSAAAAAAQVAVELLTGPEVLGGSTRLKAGTAQKIALNALSTAAMVGAGHTYGAWMVDVLASNEKLRRRAARILREATGADDQRARAALEQSGWRTKTALVALLAGLPADRAQALLERHGGRARRALHEHEQAAGAAR
ncbi:N-acetylmuramic acid 6-phosphate etherase [Nocardioides nanhaiensis]|uniref:N-acetylmuramic acid 6-phosphate etherase n=1 Tax=Nocardioides nanhaiensis TaxID=1476871 RepID=A0ABP8WYU9_9ACTN